VTNRMPDQYPVTGEAGGAGDVPSAAPDPAPRGSDPRGRPDIELRIIPDIVDLGWKSGPQRCHDGVRSR
jgi:hypothetical protein